MKLIITRGLPGCGKTTRALRWVRQNPPGRARINRDDLRGMIHNGEFVQRSDGAAGTEQAVIAARNAAISALLRLGVDVVCDDTNLPQRVVRDLNRLAVRAGADVEVWDLTDVPVDECVRRDAARDGRAHVGAAVIRDLHARYVRGRSYPLPVPEEAAAPTWAADPYVAVVGTPKAVLVDIDGTAAIMCGRSPYDETRVHEDTPNAPVIAAVRAMHAAGHAVIFCSGRTSACRAATEKWLTEHVAVPYEALYMRAVGDARKDSIVKAEIFDREIRHRYDVVAVFDDRQQVVDRWREIGLTVFQVAPGDF